jgi:3-methyladenine DNA glycosylase Tag
MIPERIDATSAADYLAVMSRAVLQAGVSWKMIEQRWPAYLRLFEGFDPVRVAAFGEADIERIMNDGGVMRTYRKIAATIENARTMLQLEREFGGIRAYVRSFGSYETASRDIKKRFKFMGELNAYYFLFRVKEPVPRFEVWEPTVEGDHPRMREMVARAREQGAEV